MEKEFRIKHVVLYAKGWYTRSTNVWADIHQCLIKHDYLISGDKEDILAIVIRNVSPLFANKNLGEFAHELVFETQPNNCWRYGYYHKGCSWMSDRKGFDKLGEYDNQTAILWFMLSKLQCCEMSEMGTLPEPDPTVLPITPEALERFRKIISEKEELTLSHVTTRKT